MIFDGQNVGLMKKEVLLRLLLERSIKEGSVSLSTAPNIQL